MMLPKISASAEPGKACSDGKPVPPGLFVARYTIPATMSLTSHFRLRAAECVCRLSPCLHPQG